MNVPAPEGVELGPVRELLRHVLGERHEVDVAGEARFLGFSINATWRQVVPERCLVLS
jgi:hypothetical protein